MSAALDAVKEHVLLPWDVPRPSDNELTITHIPQAAEASNRGIISSETQGQGRFEATSLHTTLLPDGKRELRLLRQRNFEKALKEITPSSSESLGTLAALRRWNEEFGEGRQKRKSVIWGKGLFGFSENSDSLLGNGKVSGRD